MTNNIEQLLLQRLDAIEAKLDRIEEQLDIHAPAETVEQPEPLDNQEILDNLENQETLETLETLENLEILDNLDNLENLDNLDNLDETIPEPVSAPQPAPEKEQSSTESKFGKYLMSTLASALIFISVVIFGSMIQSFLSPEFKTGLLLVAFTALSIFGIVKMGKESAFKNLFSALAACGVGGFYISMLVAHFGMETINEPTLMAGMGIWIAIVIALSRFKSRMFCYIAMIGILIATYMMFERYNDSLIGPIAYLVCGGALFAANCQQSYNRDWWLLAPLPLVAMLGTVRLSSDAQYILFAAVNVALLVQAWRYKFKREPFEIMGFHMSGDEFGKFFVVAFLSTISNYFWYLELSGTHQLQAFLMLGTGLATIALFAKKFSDEAKYIVISTGALAAMTLPFLSYGAFYYNYLWLLLPTPILFAWGVWRKNLVRYIAYLYMWLMLCAGTIPHFLSPALGTCILFVGLAAMAVCTWWRKLANDRFVLVVLYGMGLYDLSFDDHIDITGVFLMAALAVFAIDTKWFRDDMLPAAYRFSLLVGRFLKTAMIIISWLVVGNIDSPLCFYDYQLSADVALYLVVLVSLGLTVSNIKGVYNTKLIDGEPMDKGYSSLYIALKLTFTMAVALKRIAHLEMIVSVVGIAMAIGFIYYGFKLKDKVFRIYGLLLSILCVGKLCLFDFKFSDANPLARPLSFLTAGVLCFIISWLYFKIEKNEKVEKDEQQD